MKTSNGAITTPLTKDGLKELLKETNETLATNILTRRDSKNKFTLIDLWRMQKKHKTLGSSTKW